MNIKFQAMAKGILIIALSLLTTVYSCSQVKTKRTSESSPGDENKYTNHLITQTSPYLLQHAHNPVDWYPWGKEALEKAKKENKLLVISIGYAACHWCHVMEHESFEDTVVAKYMNDHFVAIKVDREERPDIDQIYMNAAYIVTGGGGWPLNIIALPDGRPVSAETYLPKKEWMEYLTYYSDAYKKDSMGLSSQAGKLVKGISMIDIIPTHSKNDSLYTLSELDQIFTKWKPTIDYKLGGGWGSTKFPMPNSYLYLLNYNMLSKNSDALAAVTSILDNMAKGGIYDQMGGGFARYSTDEYWKVPHFEKMLYDNAQLVSLYTKAYLVTQNPVYKEVVYQTLGFIRREMTDSSGGFYSSLDADSQGEEGKYYIWTKDEIDGILGSDATLFEEYYSVTPSGNWKNGQNILYTASSLQTFAEKKNMRVEDVKHSFEKARESLLAKRGHRVRPRTDDKVLTSWNALMLNAYVDAYRAFDEPHFLSAAKTSAGFLLKNLVGNDNIIRRSYKNGKASITGFLDDYAFTISAFINMYQATFDEKWLLKSKELADYAIRHFYDSKSSMFFYTPDNGESLIVREKEITDNVIPASNSEMAKDLFVLGQYFYDTSYTSKAKKMLDNEIANVVKLPMFNSNWGLLLEWHVGGFYEVSIVGPDWESKRQEFDKTYLPNVIFAGGKDEDKLEMLKNKLVKGQTMIYVCQDKLCKLPVMEVKNALGQIKK